MRSVVVLIVSFSLMFWTFSVEAAVGLKEISGNTKECLACHSEVTPAISQQWKDSRHFQANVGCYECHQAEKKDADAFDHNGNTISIIVSPKDCSRCHEKEVSQFNSSRHSKAARILGSLDNRLAEVVGGNHAMVTPAFPDGISAAAVNGCWQCHGSEVRVSGEGRLDPATWPNTGIGRINPDGSEGSCSACHSRHRFSVAQARNPENCGKCHMGPDHPQLEIFQESKHGIAYYAYKDEMNLDSEEWVVGKDYSAAPTCATCHMGATPDQEATHDVGLRISWNNRPVASIRPEVADAKLGLPGRDVDWKTRRANMKNVCMNCHTEDYVDNFYTQYDSFIALYNGKFALPGKALMAAAKPLLKPVVFGNKIDFIWFELWHHEGRRGRHGAAMMGPDYTYWHGIYEVSKHFYMKFIPELEEIAEKALQSGDKEKIRQAGKLQAKIKEVLESDDHKWFIGKTDSGEAAKRKKTREEFKKRYTK